MDENNGEKVRKEGFDIKSQFTFGSSNKIIGIDNDKPELTGINSF